MGLSNWPIIKEEMSAKKGSRGSRSRAGSGRRRGIGLLFWLCLLAIVVAAVFAARGPLGAAFSRMTSLRPAPTTAPAAPTTPSAPLHPVPEVTISPLPETSARPTEPSVPPSEPASRSVSSGAQTQETTPPQRSGVRKARLFFMSVDQNGGLQMKSVIRPIPSSDSPLRDTLDALLKGPTSQELNTGLLSMIPMESHVRNVTVRDDTAYIDFNESFRFNAQGLEALNAQLRQVVYAATEFPSVKKVQVLIEGRKVQYLGTEGVRIDVPLSRSSFRQ
jgi:spore germination protein GerM